MFLDALRGLRGKGWGAAGVVRCFITVCSHTLFYNSTLYKNTEARFAQKNKNKARTCSASDEKFTKKNNSHFEIYVMQTEQNYCTDILLTKKLMSLSINTSSHCFIFKIYPVKRLRNYTQYVTSQIFAKNHS